MIEFTDMYNDRHAIHYNDLPLYVVYHDKEIFIHESAPAVRYHPSDYVFYIKSDEIKGKKTRSREWSGTWTRAEISNFPNAEEAIYLDSDVQEDLESKMIDSFGKDKFIRVELKEKN